jgi:hypothetical protein
MHKNYHAMGGMLALFIMILIVGVAMTATVFFIVSPQDNNEPEPTTTTATFVQCWSSGVEIYSATVGSHIHRTENTVHFDTDYGSVTIMGDCVLTELIEKEATDD